MKPPTLSVLIPTYNYARYLPEAIESVLAQDYRDFELLIVDDASTDDTAEVVRPFCRRDPRVQFTAHAANVGMVNNWNFCLEKARGRCVKYLFGDDKLCHPHALGRLVTLLDAHPSATLAASARVILDGQSKAVDVWQPLRDGLHDGRKIIIEYLMENGRNLVGEPSAVLFRKEDALRGFNPAYRQLVDVEMWFHLLEKGGLVYTREPLCAFRWHAGQASGRNDATGVAADEHTFFYRYALQEWVPREAVFPLLFHLTRHLRGKRRREGAAASLAPALLEYQRQLIERGGKNWRWFCRLYYLRYRLAKAWRKPSQAVRRAWVLRRLGQ